MGHRSTTVLLVLGFTLCAFPALAAEIVVDDSGHEIQLNDDGTWVLMTRDRFATNAAGERVRLRPDGTWGRTSPIKPRVASTLPADHDVSLSLARVEILKKTLKRNKSTFTDTRTVYTLRFENNASHAISIPTDLAGTFIASSNRGEYYPIESVQLTNASVTPGKQADIRIIAQGSPKWFGVKYMQLDILPGVFGNNARRVLRKDLDDVVRTTVDELP